MTASNQLSWSEYRACNAKVRFPLKKNATARARVIGTTMRAYKCSHCRRWHIGHPTRRHDD